MSDENMISIGHDLYTDAKGVLSISPLDLRKSVRWIRQSLDTGTITAVQLEDPWVKASNATLVPCHGITGLEKRIMPIQSLTQGGVIGTLGSSAEAYIYDLHGVFAKLVRGIVSPKKALTPAGTSRSGHLFSTVAMIFPASFDKVNETEAQVPHFVVKSTNEKLKDLSPVTVVGKLWRVASGIVAERTILNSDFIHELKANNNVYVGPPSLMIHTLSENKDPRRKRETLPIIVTRPDYVWPETSSQVPTP